MTAFALTGEQQGFAERVREIAPGRDRRRVAHAGIRTAFGGPLKDQQAVSHLLAEMATRTEAARLLVDAAVQIHGARALRRGHLLEHLYREVRAPRIYEGASEVQRTIIARELYRWALPEPSPAGQYRRTPKDRLRIQVCL